MRLYKGDGHPVDRVGSDLPVISVEWSIRDAQVSL